MHDLVKINNRKIADLGILGGLLYFIILFCLNYNTDSLDSIVYVFMSCEQIKMKKILITGSSGFIGSYLVEEALSRNYTVYAGIRSSSSKKYLTDQRIIFFEMDFQKPKLIANSLRQFVLSEGPFDHIIHNAGIKQAHNKKDYSLMNFKCSKDFISAIIETQSLKQKFVYMSSIAAFGPGNGDSPINSNDVPNPISSYGKSKLQTEQFIKSLDKIKYIILRPSSVYGPRETGLFNFINLINRGLEPYIGSTAQYISLIYVKDLTRVVFDILESGHSNKAYFVSDGVRYSNYTFGQTIKRLLNKRTMTINVPHPIADIFAFTSEKIAWVSRKTSAINTDKMKELKRKNWFCDVSELMKDVDFHAKYNLETGLKESLDWYKSVGWLK